MSIEMGETVELLCKTIEAKLQLLKFTRSQTDTAIENGKEAKKVEDVHDIKVRVQDLRFEVRNNEDEIQLGSTKLGRRWAYLKWPLLALTQGFRNSRAHRFKLQRKKKKNMRQRSGKEDTDKKCDLKGRN